MIETVLQKISVFESEQNYEQIFFCHQGQNVITVLIILELLEFKTFSCRTTMVTDNTFQCSMTPTL